MRATLCLIALKKWQLKNRGEPVSLDEVVAAAGMKSVPLDPYSDKPLQMKQVGTKTVIYSVGPDGKDDRGEREYVPRENESGDLIYSL